MADQPEDRDPNADRKLAARWISEIEKSLRIGKIAEWHLKGDKVVRRFKDERDEQRDGLTFRRQRMNLLWSNVQTLSPALYARTPKAEVQRRNKDKDRIALWSGVVLERCLRYVLGFQDFDHTMRLTVSDYLLPGRGVTWEVYEPQIVKDGDAERLEWENTRTKYIHWKDFLTNPARTWEEVWWAGHRAYQSRDEVYKQLVGLGVDKEKAKHISTNIRLDHVPDGESKGREARDEEHNKAIIWCIWDKNDKQVLYVSPGWTEGTLHVGPPPLKLDNFFPCPRPLTATTATDTIIPTPDFAMYQDQADEIDELTQRIYLLSRALKVVGVYNASVPAIGQLLNDATDNTMIPVDTWAMFAQQGGLDGAVDFFPIADVVVALEKCVITRETAKQAMYEITGISDIVRGASDASETATAQQIKSQWGSLRIRDRQAEVQRFARDIIRIKAEVICETFSDDTIKKMSGVKLPTQAEKQKAEQLMQQVQQQAQQAQAMGQPAPPPPQIPPDMQQLMSEPTWEEVLALLRAEHTRGFSIDIETDSTIEPDAMEERQAAVELLTAVGGYLTAAGPLLQQVPQLSTMIGELLLFGVRRFKIGETIETTIETAMQQVQQALSQPKPDPEVEIMKQKAEIEKGKAKTDIQVKREGAQADMQIEQQKAGLEMQLDQQRMQHDLEVDEFKAFTDAQARMVEAQNAPQRTAARPA